MSRAGRKLAFQSQSWVKRADITSGAKFFFALCLSLVAAVLTAAEPEPATTAPDPVQALAKQIAEAPNDQERATLLTKADPAWLADHSLRKQLILQVYQL